MLSVRKSKDERYGKNDMTKYLKKYKSLMHIIHLKD